MTSSFLAAAISVGAVRIAPRACVLSTTTTSVFLTTGATALRSDPTGAPTGTAAIPRRADGTLPRASEWFRMARKRMREVGHPDA
ncbi:hypothetical protein ACGFYU_01015 [Streptomyces sp. NPDC048337]|uniref:hypothetical protein n=1 Tax=Streptomyces sp. NPDC048337 TaxID=3365535 RepID=UPI0037141D1A